MQDFPECAAPMVRSFSRIVASPLTGGGGGCLRRFMSALDLRFSFAAARAAVAMVAWLPGCKLGCPTRQDSLRVTADRLGTNECVEPTRSLPRWRAQAQSAEQTVAKTLPHFPGPARRRQRSSESSVMRTTPRHAADSTCEARRLRSHTRSAALGATPHSSARTANSTPSARPPRQA